MKKLLLNYLGLAAFLLCSLNLLQAQGYTVDDSATGSSFIDISATGTALGLADDGEANIDLPFDFEYFGVAYTAPVPLRVGNNGGIRFDNTTGDLFASNTTLPTTAGGITAGIFPFWDDLDSENGDVYWEVQGTAPNRQLIVQWHERPHFNGASAVDFGTFQVVFTETSNVITFNYEDTDFDGTTWDFGLSATVGLQISQSVALQYSFNEAVLENIFSIVFTPSAAPLNDACEDATELVNGADNQIGNTSAATTATNPPAGTCGDADNDATSQGVYYTFTGNGLTATVSTDNPGTDFDTEITVFTGSCDALVCADGNNDSGTGTGSSVEIETVGGTEYFVFVDGNGAATGNFELSFAFAAPDNDACEDAIVLTDGNSDTQNTDTATNDGVPVTACTTNNGTGTLDNGGQGVWYTFVGTGGEATVSTDNPGTDFDTEITVFTGTCDNLICFDGDDDAGDNLGTNGGAGGGGSASSALTFITTAGTTYYIYTDGHFGNTGNVETSLTLGDAPDCTLVSITAGTPSACDVGTYSVDVIVEVTNAPTTGDLVVNGQTFPVSVSPQTVTLVGLSGDAQPVDITASFSADGACIFTETEVFTAPDCSPDNDECDDAVTLTDGDTVAGTSINGSFNAATDTDCGLAPADGDETVWYTFVGNGEDATIDIPTGDFDTQIQVYSGTCAALTCVTSNDDGGTGTLSQATFATTDGTQYYVLVQGFSGQSGTFEISLTLPAPTACAIASVTAGTPSVCAADGTFSVDVTVEFTDAPTTGDIVVNGQTFAVTTSPQTVTLVGLNGDGNDVDIDVTFSEDVTCAFSQAAAFTAPLCAPDNDECDNAVVLTDGDTVAGTSINGSFNAATDTDCGLSPADGDETVWYTFAGNGEEAVVDIPTGSFDTQIQVYSGTCAALTCVDSDDDGGTGTLSQSTFTTVAGTQYYVLVQGFSGQSGTFEISLTLPAAPAAPICVTMPFIVELDSMGNAPAVVGGDIDGGSTTSDGGDGVTLTTDSDIFDCDDLGEVILNVTVTDDTTGETTDCTVTVSVEDNIAPVANCVDATVQLDEDGNGTVLPENINNGSTDNCTAAEDLIFDLTGLSEFTCGTASTGTVTLNITDASGNTSSCTVNATAMNLPPNIQCRQPTSTTTTPGLCIAQDIEVLPPFILGDACGIENNDVTITRTPAGNDFDLGTTVLNWSVADSDGNTATCQSLVIISPDIAPTMLTESEIVAYTSPNGCFAQVTVTAEVDDECGGSTVSGVGTFNLPFGIHNQTVTLTDVNGNQTIEEVTIYVHDITEPEFMNCPTDTVTLEAGPTGTAFYNLPTPNATDNCGLPTVTSDLSEGGLPPGMNTVTFTAADDYGTTTDCVVTVEVIGNGIAMRPLDDIESSLAENEDTQIVTWNALNAATSCEICLEKDLPGFRYVGTWWGHQYFLADETTLTRDAAKIAAEGYDAHLAVINDAAENAYLTEALGDEVRSAWIGLQPQLIDGTYQFAWDNSDALDFNVLDYDAITAETRVILTEDGTWEDATDTEKKSFLIERPCVDFTQTAPLYTPAADTEPVLLRSGDTWAEGEYEVTYELTDMCGNVSVSTFDVSVLPEAADYCTTAGTDNGVYIEEVVFHDLHNSSAANAGYADFTEENTTMNIGDGVILVNLTAGGNAAENMLYWNLYLDRNNDGDFFDAEEMIFATAATGNVQANVTLPVEAIDNARLRVMVSRYAFAAPCGDTYAGEIEDYNITLTVPDDLEIGKAPIFGDTPPLAPLYPNPANGDINITVTEFVGQDVTVVIHDNYGRTALMQRLGEISESVQTVDVRNLTPGIYHVTVMTEREQAQTQRLMIAR